MNTTYTNHYSPRTVSDTTCLSYMNGSQRSFRSLNVPLLPKSAIEQYIARSRDPIGDVVNADLIAFHEEEEQKLLEKYKKVDEERAELQSQMSLRESSRKMEIKKVKEENLRQKKLLKALNEEALSLREEQREKRRDFVESAKILNNLKFDNRKKNFKEDEAAAQAMIAEDIALKQKDEAYMKEKKELQIKYGQETKKAAEEIKRKKQDLENKSRISERIYLSRMEDKAAWDEHKRKNHISDHQRILPEIKLPKQEVKNEEPIDYIQIMAVEREKLYKLKLEKQENQRKDARKRQEEIARRKCEHLEKSKKLRQEFEDDASLFWEEGERRLQRRMKISLENQEELKKQICEKLRSEYNLTDEEYLTISQRS